MTVEVAEDVVRGSRRLLVVRTDGLGDAVIGSGLPHALADIVPGELGLIAQPSAVQVVDTTPFSFVDGINARPRQIRDVLTSAARISGAIRKFDPDTIVLPRFDFEAEALGLALAATVRRRAHVVAWSTATTVARSWRSSWLYMLDANRLAPPPPEVVHEFQRVQYFAAWLGATNGDVRPRVRITPDPATATLLQGDDTRVFVGLGIGAVQTKRQWPPERFGQLCAALARAGIVPVLLGSPDDMPAAARVISASANARSVVDLVGSLPAKHLPWVLSKCSLFVGNDSGLGHIAAAVGTPTVSVSCHPAGAPATHSNAPERFKPWIASGTVVRPLRPARPECAQGCVHDHEVCCIANVPVSDVTRVVFARDFAVRACSH